MPDLAERGAEVRERSTDLVIVSQRLRELRRALERLDTFELLEALKLRRANRVQRHQLRRGRPHPLGQLDRPSSPANRFATIGRCHLQQAASGIGMGELRPVSQRLQDLDRFGGACVALADAPHRPERPGQERQRQPHAQSVATLPSQLDDPRQQVHQVTRRVERTSLLSPEEEKVRDLRRRQPVGMVDRAPELTSGFAMRPAG